MDRFFKSVLFFLVIVGIGSFFIIKRNFISIDNAKNFLAGIFFVESFTMDSLKNDYLSVTGNKNDDSKIGEEFNNIAKTKIKVLIVPGHDNDYWGTEFNEIREADLNLKLAKYLADFIKSDNHFEVVMSRDENGYNSELLDYLSKNENDINKFIAENKNLTDYYIRTGMVNDFEQIIHLNALPGVVFRLYGINKWVNDNNVKIVLHVHFNDYARRPGDSVGDYSGFAIYIPEKQFSNSKSSLALAQSVFGRLSKYFAVSNMPKENAGIIEDQKLIAIGSNNTLNAASMLVEYGYIYESQFINSEVSPLIFEELAFQTYLGIEDLFNSGKISGDVSSISSKIMKDNILEEGMKNDQEVLKFQMVLLRAGFYPTPGFSKNDCPVSGNFLSCTKLAVKKFQESSGIKASGIVGALTRSALNQISE